jgi:hypothetical protein
MAIHLNRGLLSVGVAALAALATLGMAVAHGPAEWINQGGYRNAAGELCCGERDCFAVPVTDVSVTSGGYFVRSKHETVPFSEALPSPDGNFWRCEWGGTRKCFFAPPPSI